MPSAVPPELIEQITSAIRSLRFGTVQVTIHDGRVVQIDKLERVRLAQPTDRTIGRPEHHEEPPDQSSGGTRRIAGR